MRCPGRNRRASPTERSSPPGAHDRRREHEVALGLSRRSEGREESLRAAVFSESPARQLLTRPIGISDVDPRVGEYNLKRGG